MGATLAWVPNSIASAFTVLAAVAALAHDAGVVTLPLPQNRRQVPRNIVRRGPAVGALQFGFEMGTGARTYVTAAAMHCLLVAIILLARLDEALLAGVAFGLGRAAMPTLRLKSGMAVRWDEELAKTVKVVACAASLVVSAAIAALVLGP